MSSSEDALREVLMVEDDSMISKTIQLSLRYKGFAVTICPTLQRGREEFRSGRFELVLLDVNLPDGNGMDFCKEIRQTNQEVPILMVTAKVDEESVVRGLQAGADDYIRKPFGVEELAARMLRLLGRAKKPASLLRFSTVRIDVDKRIAFVENVELSLGKREYEILSLLIRKAGDAVTRDEILNALNEEGGIYDRTIDSHLSHLRKKLREAGAVNLQIQPLYGVGYRLVEK